MQICLIKSINYLNKDVVDILSQYSYIIMKYNADL